MGGGFENLLAGVKNFLPAKKDLPMTRVIESIMEPGGGANETNEDFLYFDPKVSRASNANMPRTRTPFQEAIGPLGSREDVPSLVSFRTCKADVVVGLKAGVEEKMNTVAKEWMVNGEYAVISFKP